MKSRTWVSIILLTIIIKWVSLYPDWVEVNYSTGLYPIIAKVQRFLFGWLPISIGDLFYTFVILVLLYKLGRFFKLLFKKQLTRHYFKTALQQTFFILLFSYVLFNMLWGLNYNRKPISYQLKLDIKKYELTDLDTLTGALQTKLNYYAGFVTVSQRDSMNKKSRLFSSASEACKQAAKKYPFLKYNPKSLKPSLFSYLGNYLGFQGYYNPFSGEGQVNTTIPKFLEPFVATHEIAHQLGYAKENEANFIGFLACKEYDNNAFRYSVYYDLYNYAIGEIYKRDTALGNRFQQKLQPQVIKDRQEHINFYKKYKNPIEPIIMWGYGEFLKANNQPAGKMTYNEVVAWLIAYYKKYGIAAL